MINGNGDPQRYIIAIKDIRKVSSSCSSDSQPIVSILTDPIQCFSIGYPTPDNRCMTRIILLPGFGANAMASYNHFLQLDSVTQLNPKGDLIKFKEFGFLRDQGSKGYRESLWRSCVASKISSSS